MDIDHKDDKEESTPAIVAAIIGNILVGIVKFIAFICTNSSAILAESLHSFVDTFNGVVVAIGIKSSKKPPTLEHPFGYGKNLYFYSFVVALLIFSLGGAVSIFKGVTAIINPEPLGDPLINYIICGCAILIEGASFTVAWRTAKKIRGNMGVIQYIKTGKDPSAFVVLFEDSAAELGLIVALIGIFLSHLTGNPIFDASASIVIGLILIAVAGILIKETKSLLIGEGLSAEEIDELVKIIEKDKYVRCCGQILTQYMGPKDLIVNIDVSFAEHASEVEVLNAIDRIEKQITTLHPEANRIFVEAESMYSTLKQHNKQERLIKRAESEL